MSKIYGSVWSTGISGNSGSGNLNMTNSNINTSDSGVNVGSNIHVSNSNFYGDNLGFNTSGDNSQIKIDDSVLAGSVINYTGTITFNNSRLNGSLQRAGQADFNHSLWNGGLDDKGTIYLTDGTVWNITEDTASDIGAWQYDAVAQANGNGGMS